MGLEIPSFLRQKDALSPCISYEFYDMIWNEYKRKGGKENGTDDTQRKIYEPING